jgi:hypothetical protein
MVGVRPNVSARVPGLMYRPGLPKMAKCGHYRHASVNSHLLRILKSTLITTLRWGKSVCLDTGRVCEGLVAALTQGRRDSNFAV